MLCLSSFELYSRWVTLLTCYVFENFSREFFKIVLIGPRRNVHQTHRRHTHHHLALIKWLRDLEL